MIEYNFGMYMIIFYFLVCKHINDKLLEYLID